MNLYNLYHSLILEEIIKLGQLNEAASTNDIDNVLNGDPNKQGKFYHVSFDYTEKDGTVSQRWVQIYQRNISTANNGLIDAFQVSKNGQSSEPSNVKHSLTGWKKFRLDRISNLKVSKVPFYQPQSGFNKNGNNSPTVRTTQKIAPVGSYKYADTTLKNKAYAEKRAQQKQVQQPVQQPVQKPVQQKQVQQKPVQQVPKTDDITDKEELNNL